MAKRSKGRQTKQNIDQASCMWGFISIFDFGHGRNTRRLLSDRKLVTRSSVASEYPTAEMDLLTNSEERHASIEDVKESESPTVDVVRTSVKELMEEELVSEQDSAKQTDADEVKFVDSECCNQVKASYIDHEICINCQDSSHKTSQYSDFEALMKEILIHYQNSDLDDGRNHTFSIVEEKLSAAVEVFMNEKSCDERSKDCIDAFQMLNSNKELFLKLLQDQSTLNPNEDQKSKPKSMATSKPEAPIARKHRNFFRRKSKSHESIPSSRIVILKPNSLDNQFKIENDVHSERISSHFSFMEIKKRLKHAMGKEQKPGCNVKTIVEGKIGWSSPSRDHFYTERFARKIERVPKLKESEIEHEENEGNGDSSRHISNIYIEAKKHLSEMLTNGDEEDSMAGNLPKTLGKIISFPDKNALSPGSSPRLENECGFVTAQMRLCPHGDCHSVSESQPGVASVDEVLDEVEANICMECTSSSVMEDKNPQGVLEDEKTENQEEMEDLGGFCKPCTSPECIYDEQHGEIVEVSEEERSPRCLESDPEEIEFSSPMGSSHSNKIEEPESTSSDKSGRPSPVSVLEPLFSDNEISPASSASRSIEYAIQPLCIQFDDEEYCTRHSMENEESAYEYVEAVLLASDLNWNEFENRWLLSADILDSSLFEEVEIFSSQPSYDQRLYFDCTNEILKEVCDCYLDFFSCIKRKVQPVPNGENLINEVWERIELHSQNNYPLSLDNIVRKDLRISRTWMDLRFDSREMAFEIDELIFEDMIDDALLSLVNDRVDNEA